MGDRCTGHCCRQFYLPFSPGELERALEATRAGLTEWVDDSGQVRKHLMEIEVIAPMVVYIGPAVSVANGGVEPGTSGHHYTCRHLAPDGNCAIYESRPSMCREYPYGKRCSFAACTWDAARSLSSNPEEAKARCQ